MATEQCVVCREEFEATDDDLVMTVPAKGPSWSSPGEPAEWEYVCPDHEGEDEGYDKAAFEDYRERWREGR